MIRNGKYNTNTADQNLFRLDADTMKLVKFAPASVFAKKAKDFS